MTTYEGKGDVMPIPSYTCGQCDYWLYKWSGRGKDYGFCLRFPPSNVANSPYEDIRPEPSHSHLVVERDMVSCGEFRHTPPAFNLD